MEVPVVSPYMLRHLIRSYLQTGDPRGSDVVVNKMEVMRTSSILTRGDLCITINFVWELSIRITVARDKSKT